MPSLVGTDSNPRRRIHRGAGAGRRPLSEVRRVSGIASQVSDDVNSGPSGESRRGAGPLFATVGNVGSEGGFGVRQFGEVGQGNSQAHAPTVPSVIWGPGLVARSSAGVWCWGLVLGKTLSVAAVRLTEACFRPRQTQNKPGHGQDRHRV